METTSLRRWVLGLTAVGLVAVVATAWWADGRLGDAADSRSSLAVLTAELDGQRHVELDIANVRRLTVRSAAAGDRLSIEENEVLLTDLDAAIATTRRDLADLTGAGLPPELWAPVDDLARQMEPFLTDAQRTSADYLDGTASDADPLRSFETSGQRLADGFASVNARLDTAVDAAREGSGSGRTGLLVIALIAAGLVVAAGLLAERAVAAALRVIGALVSPRDLFARRLADAFEVADTEEETQVVADRAMAEISGELAMELLIADEATGRLSAVAAHQIEGRQGCAVGSPGACLAVRRGNTAVFADSGDLNACRFLRNRDAPCSALCVPVTFLGHSLGVLHVTGTVGEPPPHDVKELASALASQSGTQIGTVRAFARTQLHASTDALTGLINRRTMDEHLRSLRAAGEPFAFVMADVDHFKRLNDGHGHDSGDRALRLLSDLLVAELRSSDLVARWGGEEFAVAMPGVSSEAAVEVLDRFREQLRSALSTSEVPAFTVSFGVSDSVLHGDLDSVIRSADEALYDAKEAGRDRVCVGVRAQGRRGSVGSARAGSSAQFLK